ncbi:FtsX-like permease family protein [Kitasatospora acidiphila]|uniref:FtsX-like permease family protein n=1 Tax=Kitasatospora acidiphila TaxID=2567942 RepID=A0A540W8Z8_9ACTN|nr:ABC transporter permease [Kitasatospora acidiphila]TQF05495.1 FtsX-like permease family protein [Kitasatospora acidiphila]
MSAVWRASRGAVRRRKLQTTVIGLVVFGCTVTVVLALSALAVTTAPFDDAFGKQRGAHVVASFNAATTTPAQLADTAHRPGVQAAAGPYAETTLEMPGDWLGYAPGSITVVGRADPGGPVDQVQLRAGRWATAPGEIVIESNDFPGSDLNVKITPKGLPPLTVVGYAASMSQSARGWVTPEGMAALHPTAYQMLYRFDSAGTDQQLHASLATATAGLPTGALTSTQTYLTLKQQFSVGAESFLPLLTAFGVLGLVIAVLLVGNVVSSAVVAGFRHIGVLKAIGFTPRQVVAVYLGMLQVPAVVGSVLGSLCGAVLAVPFTQIAFAGIATGTADVTHPVLWAPLSCVVGMPVLVALAALVPALRAGRLSATRAIAAGSAPRAGRGLRVQRALGGSRLPRAVSLGLGQPFARPARTALTMAAIVLGVTAVTLATGLSSTILAAGQSGPPLVGTGVEVDPGQVTERQQEPKLSPAEIEARLRALPETRQLTRRWLSLVSMTGYSQSVYADFYGGDDWQRQARVTVGRMPTGPDEVVAGPAFLAQHGLHLGDRVTLELAGRQLSVTIVGEPLEGNASVVTSNWQTALDLDPQHRISSYQVQVAPGADSAAYIKAVQAIDPGLYPWVDTPSGATAPTVSVVGFTTVFSILLGSVAALGVFNTVLLTVRERRRELGMLKSIGMTPRQVVAMTVTSVTGLGLASAVIGVPLGILVHRLIVDHIPIMVFSESMKDVWHVPQLIGLALAGVGIAVLGALVPARGAARLPIAEALRTE